MTDRPASKTPSLVPLSRAGEDLDLILSRVLLKAPPVILPYTRHLAGSTGKRLRAMAVLISAQDPQGQVPYDALLAAAALELIHLASLVHDDVIDQADLRRGQASLRKLAGNKGAVICGDYLLSRSLSLLADLEDPGAYLQHKIPNYMARLCLGELEQLANNRNFHLSPLQYFRIVRGKTAALFEAAFMAGALILGLDQEEAAAYAHFGHYVGMIFQLTDDCLDFEADIREAGKDIRSDYEQNVITLPLILALRADPTFKAELMEADARGEKLPRSRIDERVRSLAGLDKTGRLVARYGDKALTLLDRLALGPDKRHDFEQVLFRAMRIQKV